MKKTKLFIALLHFSLLMTNAFAFNYTVNFTGSGASSTIESVTVQNLTKGTTVSIPYGSVLNLTNVITSTENTNSASDLLHIYTNAIEGIFNISFNVKQAGLFEINAFSVDGRKITSLATNMNEGANSFQLSLPKGIYIVKISSVGINLSEKIVCRSNSNIKATIRSDWSDNSERNAKQKIKATDNIINMLYSTGDQLLYKGISGNYSTIVTDIPTNSKTTNFEFVECKDADGNNYSVVKIGTQTWMAENLKTTKYNDGSSLIPIPLLYDNWVLPLGGYQIGGYSNSHYADVTYRNTYGCFYNLFAIRTGKLAPVGWHVASDTEWTTLSDYLGGKSIAGGKLKSSTGWNTPNTGATNSTGFSALPGGLCESGFFSSTGYSECWWSSTFNGNKWGLKNLWAELINGYGDIDECSGGKVRCVKD